MSQDTKKRKPRWGRRLLLGVLGLIIVGVLLVGLAPTLANWGVGRGAIQGAIAKRINGTVQLRRIHLGWFGPQSIEGIEVEDAAGKQVAMLDAHINKGLLRLLWTGAEPIVVDLSGSVQGELRENGSTFGDLFARPDDAGKKKKVPAATRREPFGLTGVPPATLRVTDLNVRLQEAGAADVIEVAGLNGELAYQPGGDVVLDLAGDTTRGTERGSMKVDGRIARLFDKRGTMTPQDASGTINVRLDNVPVPFSDPPAVLRTLAAVASTDDLAERLEMTVELDAVIGGAETGRLEGQITANKPVRPDGSIAVGLAGLTGKITGRSVPSALLQPVLQKTPLVAVRDLGPTIDIDADFSGGERQAVVVKAVAEAMQLEFSGTIDSEKRSLEDGRLQCSATVKPQLFRAVTAMNIDRPAAVAIDVASLSVPPMGDDLRAQLRRVAGTGRVTVDTTATISTTGDEPMAITLGRIDVQLESAGMGSGATAKGSAVVAGAETSFDLSVPALVDADGPVSLDRLIPAGTINVRGLQPAALAAMLPRYADLISSMADEPIDLTAQSAVQAGALHVNLTARSRDLDVTATVDGPREGLLDDEGALVLERLTHQGKVTLRGVDPEALARFAPDQADLIRAAADDPVQVTAVTSGSLGQVQASLTAASAEIDLAVTGSQRNGSLYVSEARGRLTATPALLAAFQDSPDPIVLAAPADITFQLQPFELPMGTAERPAGRPELISGHLTLSDAVLENVPGMVEPVGVRGLEADATLRPAADDPSLAVNGGARLLRAADGQDVAAVRYRVEGLSQAGIGEVSFDMTDLAVGRLDAMLGNVSGDRLAEWLGERGDLSVGLSEQAAGLRAAINADFPHLAGDFVAHDDGEMVTVTADKPTLSLSRAALQRRLTPESEIGRPSRVTVVGDVPLTLAIRSLRVPRAAFLREAFDGSAADIDLALSGGPLVLDDVEVGRSSMDPIKVALRSNDLNGGVDISLTGDVKFERSAEPGRIEVNGRLTKLMSEGQLTTDQVTVAMTASAKGLNTAVIDAAADMRGMLVAAVGSPVNMEATAEEFSRYSGVLDAQLVTPNGRLDGRVLGREDGLSIDPEQPVTAELAVTRPLTERVLKKVHPLLADIRTVEQPLRATVTSGYIPLDGDVGRLSAELEVTVGAVELDSGSATLALLTIFNVAAKRTEGVRVIPGFVEPIKAKITNGVVSYDAFAVKIDKYTLIYSGSVNLKDRTVNIKTDVPLESLATTFKELEGLPPDTRIPLVTRGPIDNPKTEIAPAFIENIAKGFLEKELDKHLGEGAGKLLDGIFGGKKKEGEKK